MVLSKCKQEYIVCEWLITPSSLGAQAFQKKSLFQLLSVNCQFSQTTSERLLAQRQGIELCYLASNVQVRSVQP